MQGQCSFLGSFPLATLKGTQLGGQRLQEPVLLSPGLTQGGLLCFHLTGLGPKATQSQTLAEHPPFFPFPTVCCQLSLQSISEWWYGPCQPNFQAADTPGQAEGKGSLPLTLTAFPLALWALQGFPKNLSRLIQAKTSHLIGLRDMDDGP